MKIAIVCPYPIDAPGGVQRHILDFTNRLKALNHYVKIISPSQTTTHPDHIQIGTSYKMQGEFLGNGSTTYWPRTRIFRFEAKLQEKFDIIHVHEPFLPPFFYGNSILRNNKARAIAHIHAMNPILEKQEMLLSPMVQRIMSVFDLILASSNISGKPYKITDKKIHIIPNGVETTKLNPQVPKVPEYMDGKKNLLFVGRFDDRKGLRYLLQAWPLLCTQFKDSIRLIIVGTGSQEENIEILNITEDLPYRENILFEGIVSEERKAMLFSTADLFCSPATGKESFGMVLNEAMSAGTPVVAFDNPGYRTVLDEKKEYCMARLYDILDLSKKIVGILENKKLQKELIEWGIEEVRSKYDWAVVTQNVIDIYTDLLKTPVIVNEKKFKLNKLASFLKRKDK